MRVVRLEPDGRGRRERLQLLGQRGLLEHAGNVLRRHAGCEVDLARLVGAQLRGAQVAAGDRHLDAADRRLLAAVAGVRLHHDRFVVLVADQLVGAVGEDVLRQRPLVADLLDHRLGHRREIGQRQDGAELWGGLGGDDLEAVLPGLLDPDLVDVGDLALVVVLGVLDVVEHRGDLAAELGIEQTPPGIDPVGGGDRLPVRPFVVGVERDGPGPPVGPDLDALGLQQGQLAAVVDAGQRLEQLGVDVN